MPKYIPGRQQGFGSPGAVQGAVLEKLGQAFTEAIRAKDLRKRQQAEADRQFELAERRVVTEEERTAAAVASSNQITDANTFKSAINERETLRVLYRRNDGALMSNADLDALGASLKSGQTLEGYTQKTLSQAEREQAIKNSGLTPEEFETANRTMSLTAPAQAVANLEATQQQTATSKSAVKLNNQQIKNLKSAVRTNNYNMLSNMAVNKLRLVEGTPKELQNAYNTGNFTNVRLAQDSPIQQDFDMIREQFPELGESSVKQALLQKYYENPQDLADAKIGQATAGMLQATSLARLYDAQAQQLERQSLGVGGVDPMTQANITTVERDVGKASLENLSVIAGANKWNDSTFSKDPNATTAHLNFLMVGDPAQQATETDLEQVEAAIGKKIKSIVVPQLVVPPGASVAVVRDQEISDRKAIVAEFQKMRTRNLTMGISISRLPEDQKLMWERSNPQLGLAVRYATTQETPSLVPGALRLPDTDEGGGTGAVFGEAPPTAQQIMEQADAEAARKLNEQFQLGN